MATDKSKEEEILQRLLQVEKEYKRKKRKLERSKKASEAKAYVRMRVQQQRLAQQQESEKEVQDNIIPCAQDLEEEKWPCHVDEEKSVGHLVSEKSSFTDSPDIFVTPTTESPLVNISNSNSDVTSVVTVDHETDSPCFQNTSEQTKTNTLEQPKTNTLLSSSKYRIKNYIPKQMFSVTCSALRKADGELELPGNGNVSNAKMPQTSPRSPLEFDSAQVVVFQRQTASKVESKKENTKVDTEKMLPAKDPNKKKARKPRESSDRAVMKELDRNLIVSDTSSSAELHCKNISTFSDQSSANKNTYENGTTPAGDQDCTSEFDKNSTVFLDVGKTSRSRKRHSSELSDHSVQRRSSRIADNASQSLCCGDSKMMSPNDQSARGRRMSGQLERSVPKKRRKSILVTSMFQCLVDEVKRKSENEEFSLPDELLDLCIENSEHALNSNNNEKPDSMSYTETVKSEYKENGSFISMEERSKNATAEGVLQCSGELIIKDESIEGIPVPCNSIVDQLRLDSDIQGGQEYSISPSELTSDRPGDQCISANSSKVEVMSPPLFESQTDNHTFMYDSAAVDKITNSVLFEKESEENPTMPKIFRDSTSADCDHIKDSFINRPSEKGDAASAVAESRRAEVHTSENQIIDSDRTKSNSVSEPYSKVKRENLSYLTQIASFKLTPSASIQTIVCVAVRGEPGLYIVCQTQSQLHVFTTTDNRWLCTTTHSVKCNVRKKGGQLLYGLLDCDRLNVVLKEHQSNSCGVVVYTLKDDNLHKERVDTINCSSMLLCPLFGGPFVVGSHKDGRTLVKKYTEQSGFIQRWKHLELSSVETPVTSLSQVEGIPAALLGLTNSGILYIWNHECGLLLTAIDVGDVCPVEPFIPLAYHEKGYLVVPVLSRRKQGEGCVMVVNPHIGCAETLLTLDSSFPLNGCSYSSVMSDLLLVRTNNGIVGIFDLYTGGYLATIDDVTVTCLSTTDDVLALAHKDCVHLYKLTE